MEVFSVHGMICEANCAQTVKKTALGVKGVANADVDFIKNLLVVTYSDGVDSTAISDEVARAIEASGYTVKWGGGKCVIYIKVTGMFCGHCVGTVEKAVGVIPEVSSIVVDLDHHMAVVVLTGESQEIVEKVIDAIETVGYDAEVFHGSRDITLHISGMKCKKRCGNAVLNALRKVPGVACVQVSVTDGVAHVRGSARTEALSAAVEEAGFSARSPSACMLSESENSSSGAPGRTGDGSGTEDGGGAGGKQEPPRDRAPSLSARSASMGLGNLADSRTIFEVKGMSCGACVAAIERVLLSHEGVQQASVALLTERAEVIYDSKMVSWQQMLSAIESAGYSAKHISSRSNDNSDCQQRQFAVTSSTLRTAVDIQNRFDGIKSLKSTAGVLNIAWLSDSEESSESGPSNSSSSSSGSGGGRAVLEVTYDPAVVGLRHILEYLSGANSQCKVTLTKQDGGASDTFLSQQKALDELFHDLVFAAALTTPLSIMMWTGLLTEEVIPGLMWMDVAAILLSTPVQIFSGKRFYEEAYRGLQTKSLGMGFLVALGTSCAYLFGLFSVGHSVQTGGKSASYTDNLMTSAMLITFVLFGKYLESRAKSYTSLALKKLMEHQPNTAILLTTSQSKDSSPGKSGPGYRVENERVVSTDLLQEGDIVKVVRGMVIPADGEVVHGSGEVNEALITGEALPVNKVDGEDVIGGTQLLEGLLHVRVRGTTENSVLQQIIKLVENAQMQKAPIQQMADAIAGVFAMLVISAALFVFILWIVMLAYGIVPDSSLPLKESHFVVAFTFAISTLVVACPCAMGLATPTAIMVGTGVGAKIGILIKGGEALETANKLTTIVFDKTGTLTMGSPEVTTVYLLSASGSTMVKVRGTSTDGVAAVGEEMRNLARDSNGIYDVTTDDCCMGDISVVKDSIKGSSEFIDEGGLLWMAASAELNSEHVIGRAIVRHAQAYKGLPPLEDAGEVSATTGRGIKCMVLGYEVVVGSLNFLREENVEHSHNSTFANMAIAAQECGSIVIFVAINGSMRAMIQLADKPRPEAAATVSALRAMGKKVWIVTGDNFRTASSLGASLGIPPSCIISEALPSTKIQHVKNLQADGEFVGFVGDGINDAPAVAQADVGIAIGGGTDVAMESADMVLMRADIFSVVAAIDLSHAILRCIRRNLFWALAYNVTAIPIAAGLSLPIFHAILPPWVAGGAMAMSSVSVVMSSLTLLQYEPPDRSKALSTELLMKQNIENSRMAPEMTRNTSQQSANSSGKGSFFEDTPFLPGLTSLLSFADGRDMSRRKEDGAALEDVLEMEETESSVLLPKRHDSGTKVQRNGYGSTEVISMPSGNRKNGHGEDAV